MAAFLMCILALGLQVSMFLPIMFVLGTWASSLFSEVNLRTPMMNMWKKNAPYLRRQCQSRLYTWRAWILNQVNHTLQNFKQSGSEQQCQSALNYQNKFKINNPGESPALSGTILGTSISFGLDSRNKSNFIKKQLIEKIEREQRHQFVRYQNEVSPSSPTEQERRSEEGVWIPLVLKNHNNENVCFVLPFLITTSEENTLGFNSFNPLNLWN